MCGIAGYIGISKNNDLSFELLSKIFEQNESRGIDASGFWAYNSQNNKVYYHKEPTRSSIFTKSSIWKNLANINFNICLTHARGASKGYGSPEDNINNHPFVSDDNSIALIHNGKLDDAEYESLKRKYKIKTECDSEVILRIFECEIKQGLKYQESRINSFHSIFSVINHGHMAVAIGEIQNNLSNLWLFRNRHRPLWLVDLREAIGQIFFFSDPDLWINVLESLDEKAKLFLGKQIFTQIAPDQIYHFHLPENNNLIYDKFDVLRTSQYEPWAYNGPLVNKIYDLNNRLNVEKIVKENVFHDNDLNVSLDQFSTINKELETTRKNILEIILKKKMQNGLSFYEVQELNDIFAKHLNTLKMVETILNT